MTSDVSSASPNEATAIASGNTSSAISSAAASISSTETKPSTSMNGNRSDATSGGSSALITAIAAATRNEPPSSFRSTPGTIQAATNTDAAATSQDMSSGSTRSRGLVGSHRGSAPKVASEATFPPGTVIGSMLAHADTDAAKNSSAVRVLVCCSPVRSTPRAESSARVSAAT